MMAWQLQGPFRWPNGLQKSNSDQMYAADYAQGQKNNAVQVL